MEAVNGVSEGDKGGPPPPSPLTGCYLLIVIGEPHCNEHKDIILQRVAKGLLSWDVNDCLVDLEKELAIITEQALEGEEARYGERLIQFASENLVTEILIHPVVSTLAQCVRNLLSSFTRHRHIIHAGYTFANNGSWVLQDGTFSSTDFAEAFQEIEVLRVIRAYENGISTDLHCAPEGDWTRLPKESFTKGCKVRVNPNDVLTTGSPAITSFVNYLEPFLVSAELENILESSDVVGNIRFSRPTLYVFPGGQGDAALFGINGFNMLLDGGFSRKACFWDFVRHLDRLDAVLLTRLNNSNVNGISAVLKRKRQNALYPQIGHFFCNIQERKAILSPDGDKDKDPLLINLLDEGQDIVSNLRHLSLIPQVCYRDSEPINLYHKVGHGTLDMYVLSPAKDSKEVREFLQKWNNNDQKLFANPRTNKEFVFPLQNLVSICALLVWQPANPEDTITRILFPGSSPQTKIFEGLEKIKSLEFIKHPVCSEKSLAPTTIIKTKQSVIERIIQPEKKIPLDNKKERPPRPTAEIIDTDMKNGEVNGVQPTEKGAPVKKSDSTESEKSISKPKKIIENGEKTEKPKPRPKTELKPKARSESQQRKVKTVEKKPSPTTPKKQVEKINDEHLKLKPKPSPTSTPAKSAKEANNRKVVESKIKAAPKKEPTKPAAEKKEVKVERKPISRRPKDISKLSGSPSKKVNGVQKPDSISRRGKLDKEGTTDSSTVSTPSAEQDSILKKDISKFTTDEIQNLKAQELADLKEEQEAVKEIEAVFRKGELQQDKSSDFRKIKDISIDDKLENEEYLIIEKTEIEQDLVNESNKEEETQKIARDSEESEKQRKLSEEKETEIKEKRMEIQDEVQQIITSATDIVKAKEEVVEASKEASVTSPEDKIDVSTDKKDVEEIKETAQESQPDEKGSANIESGATTTAPTLPEDERMPLDEIKEDNGDQIIEEKHVKEDTKEKDVPVIQLPPKTFENVAKLPPVVGIRLDKQSHIRDIVKTPDEVADLPVHEEVEFDHYEEYPSATETKSELEEGKKEEGEKTDIKEKLVEEKEDKKDEEIELAIVQKKSDEEDKLEKDKILDKVSEADNALVKEKTDVGFKEEETNVEAEKDKTISKVESMQKEVAAASIEEKGKTVILEDLNKKEMSKSPDEEKDKDEHEIELKKEEIKDTTQAEAIKEEKELVKEQIDVTEEKEALKEEKEAVKDGKESVKEEKEVVEVEKEVVKDEKEPAKEEKEIVEAEKVVVKQEKEVVKDEKAIVKDEKEVEKPEKEVAKDEKENGHEQEEAVKEEKIDTNKKEEPFIEKVTEVLKEESKESEKPLEKLSQKEIKEDLKLAETKEPEEPLEKSSKEETKEEGIVTELKTAGAKETEKPAEKEKVSTADEKSVEVEKSKEEIVIKTEAISKDEEKTDVIEESDKRKESSVENEMKFEEVIEKSETEVKEKDHLKEKDYLEEKEQEQEKLEELKQEFPDVPQVAAKHETEITTEVTKPTEEQKLKDDVTSIHKIDEKLQKLKDEITEQAANDTRKIGEVTDVKEKIQLKEDVSSIEKIEERLQKLKEVQDEQIKTISEVVTHKTEEPQHAESVVITTDSLPESPGTEEKKFDDKIELGQKSPKEREEDVAKIVASVAEVLKSDAPLEEFEGKIPFNVPYKSYTTELRETHITTVESPVADESKTVNEATISPKASSTSLIEEERKIAPIHEEPEIHETKISKMIKDSNELMQATSKMIQDIKQTQPQNDTIVEESAKDDQDAEAGTVHRMLVTASSEDGGEETEICPPGTITFSKSSESSGRSSPDLQSQKLSQKSSTAETVSEVTVITKSTAKDLESSFEDGKQEREEKTKNEASAEQLDGASVVHAKEVKEITETGTKEISAEEDVHEVKSTTDINLVNESIKQLEKIVSETKDVTDAIKSDSTKILESTEKLDIEEKEVSTKKDESDIVGGLVKDVKDEKSQKSTGDNKEETEVKIESAKLGQAGESKEKISEVDEIKEVTTFKEDDKKIETIGTDLPSSIKEAIEDVEKSVSRESVKDVAGKTDETTKSKVEEIAKEESESKKVLPQPEQTVLKDSKVAVEKVADTTVDQQKTVEATKEETVPEILKEEVTVKKDVITDLATEVRSIGGDTKKVEDAAPKQDDLQKSDDSEKDFKVVEKVAVKETEITEDLKKQGEKDQDKKVDVVELKETITKEAEDVLESVKDALKKTEDKVQTKVEAVVKDVEEKKSFLGGLVNDIGTSLLSDTTKLIEDAQQQVDEIKDSVKIKIDELKEDVTTKKEILETTTKDIKESKIDEVKESVTKEKEKLVEATQKIEETLEAKIDEAKETVTEEKEKLLQTKEEMAQLSQSKLDEVKETVTLEKEKLLETTKDFEKSVTKEVESVTEKIKSEVKETQDIIEEKVKDIKDTLTKQEETVTDVIGDVKETITSEVETKMEDVKKVVLEEKDKAKTEAQEVSKSAVEKIDEKINELAKHVDDVSDKTKETVDDSKKILEETKDKITEKAAAEIKEIESKTETILDDIKSKEESILKTVDAEVKEVKENFVKSEDKVTEKLDDLSNDLAEALKDVADKQKDTEVSEKKYDLYNGLESVEKMVVDVLTADRKEAESKLDHDKKSDKEDVSSIVEKVEKDVENIVDKGVAEIKEFVEETKEAITSIFKRKPSKEEILEKTAHDIEENFEIMSDMTKSVVFEKCIDESLHQPEKLLEKSAESIEKDYDTLTDMAKSIVFEKCDKPPTEEQKEERILEEAAESLERDYEIVSDMTKSVVFEKCDKPLTEEQKEEKFLEKSAESIEKDYEIVTDIAKSMVFEKCEQTLTEEQKEERVLEREGENLEKDYEIVSDMAKSTVFEKCDKPLTEEQKEEKLLERSAKDIEENYNLVSDMAQSIVFDKCGVTKEQKAVEEKVQLDASQKETESTAAPSSSKDQDISKESTPKLSGEKSTDINEDQASKLSGKSSPVLPPDTKDLLKEESGKSTPDIKEIDHIKVDNQDSLLSGKSSPGLSGKSSPILSGRSSPGAKAESKDSLLSGKSTPEHTKPDSKESSLSGKSSPGLSGDLKADEKEKAETLAPESKDQLSAKSSPAVSGKSSPVLISDVKDTEKTEKSSAVLAVEKETEEKSEKEPQSGEIKKVEKVDSGKASPEVKLQKDVAPTISEKISGEEEKDRQGTKDLKSEVELSIKEELIASQEREKISAKGPDISAEVTSAILEKKTESQKETESEVLSGKSLEVKGADQKKLSISDVQISVKESSEEKAADFSKSDSPEDTKQSDDKMDSIDSGIGTEVDAKAKKTEELEKTAASVGQITKEQVSSLKTEEKSIAGPSLTSIDTSLSPAKSSTEDLHLSGKSTPDIAEVERMKEMQETLKQEKHILGSSTPPTVPASPIVKDISSTQVEEAKSAPLKSSTITSIKDSDIRSCTPGSDDYEIGASTHSDISSGQVSRAPHLLESERIESDEDDDVPGSPMSVTSQVAHSRSSSRYDFEDERIGTKMDPMNTSFYGALPDEEDTELEFEKAMAEHRQTRGEDLVMPAEESPSYLYELTKAKYSSKTPDSDTLTGQTQLDQINKNGASNVMTASFMGDLPTTTSSDTKKDVLDSWGKPLGLPSPAPPNDNRGTPKKERKLPSNVSAKNKLNDDKKRSESPSKYKNKKVNPVYVDLTYVPHHGNSYYSYVDFFKRIRARYYVFSGIEPSREVYNALLEAKQTWDDKELEVTIIPTYDTDILGYWVAENEELLTKFKIDLSPSASRCTINLQDHETSCSAYRLEF